MTEPDAPGMAEGWHLDKKVPITLIVLIILQAIGCLVYVGRMEARFDQRLALLESKLTDVTAGHRDRDERQDKVLGETVTQLRDAVREVNGKLDRLIERTRR
jgi:hypothetical protein